MSRRTPARPAATAAPVTAPDGKVTSSEMTTMLRRHYLPESKPASGYFCPELQAPSGRRRADLIWLPLTSYERGNIIGHEIKVSRADVVQELADLTKADAWAKYCTQWWLVVSDPKLIDGLTIPERWGVMAPPSGRRTRSMTVVKEAPKLVPEDQSAALAAILARMFYHGDSGEQKLESAVTRAERSEVELRRVQEELRRYQKVADAGAVDRMRVDREDAQVRLVVAALEKLHSQAAGSPARSYLSRATTPEMIARTILDHAATRRATDSMLRNMENLMASVADITDPFRQVAPRLEDLRQGFQADIPEPL